jgi:hypothetical protein
MRACPVCETPSDERSAECPTCGKVFATVAVPDAPAATLADLDLGRNDARTLQVANDGTPDVEYLSLRKVGEVATEVTPDMEQTARAPVGEVATEVTPDMEQTRVAEKEWTPESDGPVICRACQTPQGDPDSIFCQACGYRLPVRKLLEAVLLLPDDVAIPASAPAEPDPIKCPMCGCMTPPGGLCRACGVALRPLSA